MYAPNAGAFSGTSFTRMARSTCIQRSMSEGQRSVNASAVPPP